MNASCPSVRLFLSVCLSVTIRTEIKIGVHVPQGTSTWNAIFCAKRSKVKVTGRKNLASNLASCSLTGGRTSAGGSGADCQLGLTIVSPNLLSVPEMLGNLTDGRISCRHSAATSFLVYFGIKVVWHGVLFRFCCST